MKIVKVFNAKEVKVMRAGRKDNRKSVLVVPKGMSGKDLREWKEDHFKRLTKLGEGIF